MSDPLGIISKALDRNRAEFEKLDTQPVDMERRGQLLREFLVLGVLALALCGEAQ